MLLSPLNLGELAPLPPNQKYLDQYPFTFLILNIVWNFQPNTCGMQSTDGGNIMVDYSPQMNL